MFIETGKLIPAADDTPIIRYAYPVKPGSAIESPGYQAPRTTTASPGSVLPGSMPHVGNGLDMKRMLGGIPPIALYGGLALAAYFLFFKKGR